MRVLMKCFAMLMLFMEPAASSAAELAKGLSALDRGDYADALAELRPLAERGDAWAEYELGLLFSMGLGVPRDLERAAVWLKKSAAQGNAHAQNDLGTLYDQGRGVRIDPEEAARLYRQAAEQGLGAAQINLTGLYRQGRGVPMDLIEAYAWASTCAKLGEPGAEAVVDSIACDLSPLDMQRATRRAQKYQRAYLASVGR